MYLKGVNIQGFKSFADKVELQFGPGVSVVVGPNGSGKSNIVDAMRWVLGEQSVKSLRGAKMEDIIFSGSTKRKAVGLAEVSLTLDNTNGYFNSQYSEISITRRFYRSGEGEFLINKRPCRLKDVHELFMDTGLGREAFSIIGQGKVDEILNSKPEERRFLVEEVAGIIKYKNRKKEASKKLEETELHLHRISDLINELGDQLGPLQLQSSKALKYKEIKKELDALEIAALLDNIEAINRNINIIQGEFNTLQKEKILADTELTQKNAQFESIKYNLHQKNEALSELQQSFYQIVNQLEKLEGAISHNNSLLKEYSLQKNNSSEELVELQERQKSILHQITQMDNQLETVKAKEADQRENLIKIERQLTIEKKFLTELITAIEELKQQLFDNATNRAQQKNLSIHGDAEHKKLFVAREKKEQESNKLIEEIALLEEKEQQIINQLKKIINDIDNYTNSKKQLESELFDQNQWKQGLLKSFKEKELDIQQKMSRLKVLRDMQSSYEGYQFGVKAILKEAEEKPDRLPGIVGTVGELIKVEKKYITAIETALGGAIQNIVTTTQQAAKLGIAYLKGRQAGRCTFLPIDSIQAFPKFNLSIVKDWPKVYGIASELMDYEAKLSAIIGQLLNRTVIVEDIDTAIKVAKEFQYKVKVVTVAGEVVSPGGALTGGSSKVQSGGLLSRGNEIEQLDSYIQQKQNELAATETDILKSEQLCNGIEEKLQGINEAIQQIKVNKVELDKDISQSNSEIIRNKNYYQLSLEELAQIKEELIKVQLDTRAAQARAQEYDQNEEKIQALINSKQIEAKKSQERIEQLNQEVTEEKVALANVTQDTVYTAEQITNLKETLNQDNATILKKEQAIDSLAERISDLDKQIIEDEQTLRENIAFKKEKETQIVSKKNEIALFEAQLKELEVDIKRLTQTLSEKTERLHQLEIRQTRAESEQTALVDRLTENFSLNINEAKELAAATFNRKQDMPKIKTLKKELEELG
ncbi:MAG: chromosome segregation protein SMC, partial [Bacillota bacterium]|nr:chromosome segregation protein SMC [Bacillota bacterium]